MESSLKALDVCFKFFQVLNASYPSTVKQLWTFIQKYVYNIHTEHDVESSCHEEIAVDLSTLEPDLK